MVRDVSLLAPHVAARPAHLNDNVMDGSAVHTGADSRAELTFADLTITRVGANSIFSFDQEGRNLNVESGAILLRVPKGSGGAHIRSSALTVGITGTTVMFESRPRNGLANETSGKENNGARWPNARRQSGRDPSA
ncbi:MAG: hypothetical protein DMF76_25350 [Acidobacteria bacterium]|nr:MAG: hypothetical protein DMF76_25350 [Acidobacteriota bacterium]